MENETQLLQLAQDLGLKPVLQDDPERPCWVNSHINGIKFEIEYTNNNSWLLVVAHGDMVNREPIREAFPDCSSRRQGVFITCSTYEELAETAFEVRQFILDNELGRPFRQAAQTGVTFEGTDFANMGELAFMARIVGRHLDGNPNTILGVGSNLGFEYQVPSTGSRIDAVEFDAVGNVITVIECQSGIQHGNYLDDEHFAKSISRYPQSEEIRETVKKIVVIAGGFAPEQLATFGQLPYEIVALKTVVVDNKVALEVVA